MSEPTPPDIKNTRIRIVIGATMVGAMDKIITLDKDCSRGLPLRFTEDKEEVGDKPDYTCEFSIEFEHGTVDEIVEDFRAKLERAFQVFAWLGPDGKADSRVDPARVQERWAEIAHFQELLAESDCAWTNGTDKGVHFILGTPTRRVEARKARETLKEDEERRVLLTTAGLDDI